MVIMANGLAFLRSPPPKNSSIWPTEVITPATAAAPVTTDEPAAAQPTTHRKRHYSRRAHVTNYNVVPSLGAMVSGNF